MTLAAELFDALDAATRRGAGIVRDSYGIGEQAAHDILRAAAEARGLETRVDAIGNLTMALPGRNRAAPRILLGSHLDSSPQAGNFDGAAGVIAGLCVVAGLRRAGVIPAIDVDVMALRGEESSWFNVSYIGSAGAFGLLDPASLGVRRRDSGQTLEAALRERGFDPDAIRTRRRLLDPAAIAAYIELHIEQGPTLVERGLPAAVVTAVRGCQRFRDARCFGRYGHSGTVERAYRQDAVAATVALLGHLEAVWLRHEAAGEDLVITSGEFNTDPELHAPSKIAGETRFVIDVRSTSETVMRDVVREARTAAAAIGARYRVRFELGETTDSPAALMDQELRQSLLDVLERPFEMPSGAGHDAATFAAVGIPTAMLFVRNHGGSHNPEEHMDLEDFAVATRALHRCVLQRAAHEAPAPPPAAAAAANVIEERST
jgi:N-carbamoyl-L-amino-acid hydrolase